MQPNNPERGNAFFMILMAVVLFAALAFTFTKGIQQGGENISSRKAALDASDIITYAQKVERAVQFVVSKGNSENDISFENDFVTGYTNLNCVADKRCEVFKSAGAGLAWQNPPEGANDGEPYFFGPNQVAPSTEATDPAKRDLVMLLPVKAQICTELNKMTTKVATWDSTATLNDSTKFTGDFTAEPGSGITWTGAPDSRPAGCFCVGVAPCDSGDDHYFYYVLHSR